ncbi:5-formyltetrahydrofolate cyclo-ligase [Sphingomonas japonica]|uniref:5-formyltetrahydrofolate cyclo-ligase n=1 Tax=Sphingomonas japonica TaxID=511662 RepID=A0ABX0TW73_9SPHN|nr:5-formyltetrahydrofolate cyclo-ligase [Sphingomonas japonica]NIJ22568.1 5-formyltetrahydrofolate cyclo-ligase [Sphingomonas japonica]
MTSPKSELRAQLRARRAAFVANLDDRLAATDRATTHILDRLDPGATLSAYGAIGDEIDAMALLIVAADRGHATALPQVTTRDQPMRFLAWRPGDPLVPGPFGLQQPAFDASEVIPDVIVTPLLGFDRSGGRIGQGAGFYDRAFAAHPFARRIGLAWSAQEVASLPLDPWDVPLHAVATEAEWITIAGVR